MKQYVYLEIRSKMEVLELDIKQTEFYTVRIECYNIGKCCNSLLYSNFEFVSQVQNTLGQDKVKMDYSEQDGFFFKISKKVWSVTAKYGYLIEMQVCAGPITRTLGLGISLVRLPIPT